MRVRALLLALCAYSVDGLHVRTDEAAAVGARRPHRDHGAHHHHHHKDSNSSFWNGVSHGTMKAAGSLMKATFGAPLSHAQDAAMEGGRGRKGQDAAPLAVGGMAAAAPLAMGTAAAAAPMAAGTMLGGAMGAAAMASLLTPFAPFFAVPLAAGAMTSAAAGAGASALAAVPVGALSASAAVATGGAANAATQVSQKVAEKMMTKISDPDSGLSMRELVERRGYPMEEHNVTTADGYILTMFRIPSGVRAANSSRNSSSGLTARRPAVLLQHGLLDCSMSFVANFPNQSLAFLLADAGYDVWLGNNRGNEYGRAHTSLSPSQSKFWDFTWEEMAHYDLPTEVDYVLRATNSSRLAFICHSEGSTQAFASLSVDPDLAAKFSVLIAMAPVAYVQHQKAPLLSVLAKTAADKFVRSWGDGFYLLSTESIKSIAPVACRLLPRGCSALIDVVAGRSSHVNRSRLHVYSNWFPQGTSTKNLVHWAHGVRSGTFSRYDYGRRGNEDRYESDEPPSYNLSNITVPLALFSGSLDQLADQEDVRRLKSELRPGVVFMSKEVDGYAHTDFILAADANELLYPDVLRALASHMP